MFGENPTLSMAMPSDRDNVMSIQGVARRALLLLGVVICFAALTWAHIAPDLARASVRVPQDRPFQFYDVPARANTFMIVGCLGGFVTAMVVIFITKESVIPILVYGALEGVSLGAISAIFEQVYPGIAGQAFVATMGVASAVLMIYCQRWIVVDSKFEIGVLACLIGLLGLYVVNMFFSFSFLDSGSGISMLVSGAIILLAAACLLIDFKMIEDQIGRNASKDYEWYAAFGLMVTLIWMYIEILQLLAKARSGDNNHS